MIGRVFHLYTTSAAFLGGLMLIGAALLWQVIPRFKEPVQRDTAAWSAAILGLAGWLAAAGDVLLRAPRVPAALVALGLGLPVAAIFALSAVRAARARAVLVTFATITGLGTSLIACAVDLDSMAAIGCIVVGVAVAVWGAALRAPFRTVSGSLVALFGLVVQVWLATQGDNVLRWASMSVVGVLLIVGSAYVERSRTRLARFWGTKAQRPLVEEAA
jgi:hypothetical protein